MRQWLFGAKLSPSPMITYYRFDLLEQTSNEIGIKRRKYPLKKMHLKTNSVKWRPFWDLNVLNLFLPLTQQTACLLGACALTDHASYTAIIHLASFKNVADKYEAVDEGFNDVIIIRLYLHCLNSLWLSDAMWRLQNDDHFTPASIIGFLSLKLNKGRKSH